MCCMFGRKKDGRDDFDNSSRFHHLFSPSPPAIPIILLLLLFAMNQPFIGAKALWKRRSDEIRLTYQSAARSSLQDSNGSVQSRQNKKAFGVRGAHSSDTNKWNHISSQLSCRYIYIYI
ncbi:hypothetical protein YC2023_077941 [Brassica napus]